MKKKYFLLFISFSMLATLLYGCKSCYSSADPMKWRNMEYATIGQFELYVKGYNLSDTSGIIDLIELGQFFLRNEKEYIKSFRNSEGNSHFVYRPITFYKEYFCTSGDILSEDEVAFLTFKDTVNFELNFIEINYKKYYPHNLGLSDPMSNRLGKINYSLALMSAMKRSKIEILANLSPILTSNKIEHRKSFYPDFFDEYLKDTTKLSISVDDYIDNSEVDSLFASTQSEVMKKNIERIILEISPKDTTLMFQMKRGTMLPDSKVHYGDELKIRNYLSMEYSSKYTSTYKPNEIDLVKYWYVWDGWAILERVVLE